MRVELVALNFRRQIGIRGMLFFPTVLALALAALGTFVILDPSSKSVSADGNGFTSSKSVVTTGMAQLRVVSGYGKLPLSFEANAGQTDARVKFLARGQGYTMFLTGDEAVLALRKSSVVSCQSSIDGRSLSSVITGHFGIMKAAQRTTENGPRTKDSVLQMKLVGANAKATLTGADELPGKSNYFIGNDPKKWRNNVSTYAKVKYTGVYPGVDLVYYGNQGQLEYDFVVAPGADPSAIALDVGADGARPAQTVAPTILHQHEGERSSPLQIAPNGDLIVLTDGGEVRFYKPIVYQNKSAANRQSSIDNRQLLEGHYVLMASNQVRFALGPYDHSKPLVIDPVLAYSTYLGGSVFDGGYKIQVDVSGSAYVAGDTISTDFPTAGPLQGISNGGPDAFVTKINATGSALVYSTYLGGSGTDYAVGIAVDRSGNAYVTGITGSTDFPTANALQGTYGGGISDGFVAKLSASGSALVYSTYLGGSNSDTGYGVALDRSGNAYVIGTTMSTDFPIANPLQATNHGGNDAFVAKLNTTGSAFVYSTYLGGSLEDFGRRIAVDGSGNAYVTGGTASTDFPTANPLQGTNHGGFRDAFVAKINAAGSGFVYSTYLGGSDDDYGLDIALDSSRNVYITGPTASTDFPIASALQGTNHGAYDAFVTKLNAAGSALVYSTYLGGGGRDDGLALAVDSSGNAYVTGDTNSSDFPTVSPLQATNHGGYDAFVTKLDASGLLYSTYLGGLGGDIGWGIAVDRFGNAYVTGQTNSTDFPTANPLQATNHGDNDAFVAKITLAADLAITNSAPSTVTSGSTLTYTIQVINFGPDTATGVKIKDTIPAGTAFNSVTISAGSCTAPPPGGSGTVNCTISSLATGGSVTETLTVNVTASKGKTITDTATVSSMTFDPNKANNSAKAVTKVM